MTAVALADKQQTLDCLVVTEVTFRRLSEQDIADYVASGEPLDKAGAYGIQGLVVASSGRLMAAITP